MLTLDAFTRRRSWTKPEWRRATNRGDVVGDWPWSDWSSLSDAIDSREPVRLEIVEYQTDGTAWDPPKHELLTQPNARHQIGVVLVALDGDDVSLRLVDPLESTGPRPRRDSFSLGSIRESETVALVVNWKQPQYANRGGDWCYVDLVTILRARGRDVDPTRVPLDDMGALPDGTRFIDLRARLY
jgi:hypothetical protein